MKISLSPFTLPLDLNGWWILVQLIISLHITLISSHGLRPQALLALEDMLKSSRSESEQLQSDHSEERLYISKM